MTKPSVRFNLSCMFIQNMEKGNYLKFGVGP